MKTLLSRIEDIYLFIAIFLASGAVVYLLINPDPSRLQETNGGIVGNCFVGIYLAVLFLLLLKPNFHDLFTKNKMLWILMLFIGLSFFWSAAPTLAITKFIALFGGTLLGIYIATKYSLQQLLRVLLTIGYTVVVLSFVFVMFLPEYGLHSDAYHAGAWRGVFENKNGLGKFMVLVYIVSLISFFKKKKLTPFLLLSLSLALIILSTSSTAIILIIFITTIFIVFSFIRKVNFLLLLVLFSLIFLVAVGLIYFLLLSSYNIFDLLGKDSTLTGRTELWNIVWHMILNKPLLGYGYQSFWLGLSGEYSRQIWSMLGWEVPHSHNGILDLLLQLGFIGTTIYLLFFISMFIKSLILIRTEATMESLFPMLFLVYVVFSNLTESSLLTANSIYWLLFIIVSVQLNQFGTGQITFLKLKPVPL